MALLWIDDARRSLSAASNSYAKIQKELDKYNKIFEVYAHANPETQIRAASVMRQAMDEYNGLKKQQEENSTRIFQARQWIDYYNKSTPQALQQEQVRSIQSSIPEWQVVNVPDVVTEETIPVIDTATPWVVNNNTPTLSVELPQVRSATVSVPKTTSPATVWIVNYYQPPKNVGQTTNIATKSKWSSVSWPNYWPGSVAPMPWTWGVATLNTTPIYNTSRSRSLWDTLADYARRWARYIYKYLRS